jgi:hypothetical protein
MSERTRYAAAALALLALLLAAAPATADVGPIQLVSKSGSEQATVASAPALSSERRYLAFQGKIGGLAGVFRKDLATGSVAAVATGPAFAEGAPAGRPADASAPSISADGRFVSFTTSARLDPADDLGAKSSDVYVADMASVPPTYTLASARNGCLPGVSPPPCGLGYKGEGGAVASGRVALSADGQKVAFITTAESDLTAALPGSFETPAGQVVLRDLATGATTLVSAARNIETGAFEAGVPVSGGAALVKTTGNGPTGGAALSADGTTIAWLGVHIPAQVPLLEDERKTIETLDTPAKSQLPYDEPLWRRVADGPSAPTRRVVGGGDPEAPGCPPGGTLAEPACQGPFPGMDSKVEGINNANTGWVGATSVVGIDGAPQLSADGYTVALIGNPVDATNVFVVDMRPGLTRKQALRQLTRQVPVRPSEETGVLNVAPFVPLNGHFYDLAISADGSRVVFATARQQFPLAPPTLVSQPPGSLGLVELYLANLSGGGTLLRLTHGTGSGTEASLGPGNAEAGDGASAPSIGAGNALVAFSSTASNLVEGDGNDAADVFTVRSDEAPRTPGVTSISSAPPGKRAKRVRNLRLSSTSLPNGDVRLVAVVPAAGKIRASAASTPVTGGKARRLSKTSRRAKKGGPVTMTLKLSPRVRRLAHGREGVYATATVRFRPRQGQKLEAKLPVRFHSHPAKKKGKSKGGSR